MNKEDREKTILLADESPTNTTLFKALLEKKGFKTTAVHDGLSALAALVKNKPDIVAFSTTLPVYDGFQLARIISSCSHFSTIPIVVFAFENTSVYKFWKENTNTDLFCTLDDNNPKKLCETIEKALKINKSPHKNQSEKNSKYEQKTNTIENILEQAHAKDLFDTYVNQSIFEAGMYLNDMTNLVTKMIQLLSGICGYDAACLFIHDKKVYEYSDLLEDLSFEEKDDFLAVCREDFNSILENNYHYEVKHITITPSNIVSRKKNNNGIPTTPKLQSYECFELKTNDFLGTLHIAHTQAHYFTGRTQERCTIYAKKLEQLLTQLLYTRHLIRAEKTMKKAFSRFVPEKIINDLVTSDNAYNDTLGENREVAVLICDIRNFTNISEINLPETVVSFLNHYFSIICDILQKHGGTIDKFMGDAVMALFGATLSHKDNASRAVKAALEINTKLDSIDTSTLVFPAHIQFDIGIGIHYGNVIVGSIGSKDKSDFTVIGDTVNLASRIEELNKLYGTKILITNAVKKNIDESFSLRLIDRVKVKGKSNSVEIYSVDLKSKKMPASYIDNYKKAIQSYMIGGWSIASSYFEKSLLAVPDDPAAKILYQRCLAFIKNPPVDWNGAITLTTK